AMRTVLRLLAGGGAVVALPLAVVYLSCNGPDPGAADEEGGRSFWEEAQQEQRHGEELETRLAGAVRRNEVMAAAVQDVIAARLTLGEAAACFRVLARENPDFPWELFRRDYAGASDEERHCRQLIAAVQVTLGDEPDEAAAVGARLEAELQELLEHD